MTSSRDRLAPIKLIIFDVDGVLTDGRIVLDDNGVESKFFHVRDGSGLGLLRRAGHTLALITGRRSRVVDIRAGELKIPHVYQGVHDKLEVYEKLLADLGLTDREAAFAGDDLIDLKVMKRVGLAMAPADASAEVLGACHFISRHKGGKGAVREMAEYILKGQGLWEKVTSAYF